MDSGGVLVTCVVASATNECTSPMSSADGAELPRSRFAPRDRRVSAGLDTGWLSWCDSVCCMYQWSWRVDWSATQDIVIEDTRGHRGSKVRFLSVRRTRRTAELKCALQQLQSACVCAIFD